MSEKTIAKNTDSPILYHNKLEEAERLRCTTKTIENWMLEGMPHVKFSRRKTLFIPAEVDGWIAARFKRVLSPR